MSTAKVYREAMKAKAKRLASPGSYAKDQEVSSADWSPAPELKADVKTGARPISKRAYKDGGKVMGEKSVKRLDRKPRASGGEIADAIVKRNTKEVIGSKDHVGGFKKGGRAERKDGGGVLNKKAVGEVQVLPKRNKAENYKRGGGDPSYVGAASVTEDNKPVMSPKGIDSSKRREPDVSDLYSSDQAKRLERGYKNGGSANWIADAIKKPGALHKQLGVPEGEKIPAKKLAKAADKPGKLGQRARLAETLKRINKKRGGEVSQMPNLTVVIADKGAKVPQMPMVPPAPMGAAPAPTPMPPAVGAPAPALIGRKSGGRITKKAASYKDMEAGAGSGEGRLQKTDIAKRKIG